MLRHPLLPPVDRQNVIESLTRHPNRTDGQGARVVGRAGQVGQGVEGDDSNGWILLPNSRRFVRASTECNTPFLFNTLQLQITTIKITFIYDSRDVINDHKIFIRCSDWIRVIDNFYLLYWIEGNMENVTGSVKFVLKKMLQYLPAEWNSPPPSVSPSQRFPKTKLNNSQVVAEILHVLQPLVHLVTIRINRFCNFHEGPHWCINFSWDKTKAKIDA